MRYKSHKGEERESRPDERLRGEGRVLSSLNISKDL